MTVNSKTISRVVKSTWDHIEIGDVIRAGDTNAYHLSLTWDDVDAITGAVNLHFVLPDGTVADRDASDGVVLSGKSVTYTLEPALYNQAGTLVMYVQFADSNLYTPLRVTLSGCVAVPGGTPVSSAQIWPAWYEDAQAAELARAEAEDLRVSAESARDIAEGLRDEAEGLRDSAETARDEAEGLRESAESARVTAESARAVWEAYDSEAQYAVGEKVYHLGSSYICHTIPPVGTLPTDTGYWSIIVQKGDTGAAGTIDNTTISTLSGILAGNGSTVAVASAAQAAAQPMTDPANLYDSDTTGGQLQEAGTRLAGIDSQLAENANIDALGDVAESLHRGVGVNNQIFAPRTAIFLRFDDGNVADETVYASLLARHLVAGFAVVETYIGTTNYLTLERLMELQANGMEIMHHSKTHPTVSNLAQATAMGVSGFIEETVTSADRLRALGLNIQSFVLPGTISGADNPMYFNTAAKLKNPYANVLMRGYRNAQAYVYVNGSATETMPASRMWGHACSGTIESTTLAALQASIDDAIKFGGVYGFNSHSFNLGTAGKLSWADFNLFLDYLVTKRAAGLIEVLTPSGAAFCRLGKKLNLAYDTSFETITTASPGWWILKGGTTIETTGGRTGNNFAHIPYAGGTGNLGTNLLVKDYRTIEVKYWAKAPSTTAKHVITVADTMAPKQYQLSAWGGITKMDFAPVAGGTGYTVGDLLTITGGAAVARVVSVNESGAVTGLVLLLSGLFYSTGTKVTTGGTGTGCTVNVVEVVGAAFQGQTLTVGNTWTPFHFTFGIHDLTTVSITVAAMSTGDGAIDIDDFEISLI